MILPAKSIRDVPAVWTACLPCGLLCCLLFLRVLCGLVRWSKMLCGVCAAVSGFGMGFWVCGSGGGSSRARYYLQVRRAKRGSRLTVA